MPRHVLDSSVMLGLFARVVCILAHACDPVLDVMRQMKFYTHGKDYKNHAKDATEGDRCTV